MIRFSSVQYRIRMCKTKLHRTTLIPDPAIHLAIVHVLSYISINALHRNFLVILAFPWYFSLRYFATPTSRSYRLLIFFSLIMQDYPMF